MPRKTAVALRSRSSSSAKRVKLKQDGLATREVKISAKSLRSEVKALKVQLLLRAAAQTFYDFGYNAATVDMITAQVSGTKAIFYYNYRDKASVLEAIFNDALDASYAVVEKAISEGGAASVTLSRVAEKYAEWVIDNQLAVGVFWREERNLSAATRNFMARKQKKLDDMFAAVLERGVADGEFIVEDARLTGRAISGMLTFTYTWWRPGGNIGKSALAKQFSSFALRIAGYRGHER